MMRRTGLAVAALSMAAGLFLTAAIAVGGAPQRGGSVTVDPGALLSPGGLAGAEGAVEDIQARLRSDPRDWRAAALLGLAYLQRSRTTGDPSYAAGAERALARSVAIRPRGNFEAAVGMSSLAASRHDFETALRWARRATAVNPDGAEGHGLVGDAFLELGRYRAAGRAFQRMIDLRPGVSSYARVSYFRELHGDVSGAIEAMRLARQSASSPEDAAWTGYRLGELYLSAGRIGPARSELRRAAGAAPDHVLPRAGLARVAAARGDLDRAARMLEGIVARYPAPELAVLLADVHRAAGHQQAARDADRLVRAIDRLARAAGIDTAVEMALFEGDRDAPSPAAVIRARRAYRDRPSVVAADALGWILSAAGRHREAARFANEALRLGTRSATFHYHAGIIELRLGRDGPGFRHLATALRIDPRFSPVQAEEARAILERRAR
jgi:tetratricopeptide (TPR) repeat protein